MRFSRSLNERASGRRNLIQIFLEIIVATAFADGRLDAREKTLIEEISHNLGYSKPELDALISRLSGQAHFHR